MRKEDLRKRYVKFLGEKWGRRIYLLNVFFDDTFFGSFLFLLMAIADFLLVSYLFGTIAFIFNILRFSNTTFENLTIHIFVSGIFFNFLIVFSLIVFYLFTQFLKNGYKNFKEVMKKEVEGLER